MGAKAETVPMMKLPTDDSLFVDEGAADAAHVLDEQRALHPDDASMAGRDGGLFQTQIVVP